MIVIIFLHWLALSLCHDIVPGYVHQWLAGQGDLPGDCLLEGAELGQVPFLQYGRCSEVESNCEYIPYGKMDSKGRLEGESELVIHWTKGDHHDMNDDSHESYDDDEDISDNESYCYSVDVSLSIRAVRGYFRAGVPQGKVTLEHRNGEETVGTSVDGVLHGVTVTKNRDGKILYLGRYNQGRPDGWGWAFSPSNITDHGVLAIRVVGGVVEDGVYLDTENNRTVVGSYDEQAGTLSGYLVPGISLRVRDCLPYITLCPATLTTNTTQHLPFLVRLATTRVRVSLRDLVVYNRVPKTGSQALLFLLRDLSEATNRFRVHFPPTRYVL